MAPGPAGHHKEEPHLVHEGGTTALAAEDEEEEEAHEAAESGPHRSPAPAAGVARRKLRAWRRTWEVALQQPATRCGVGAVVLFCGGHFKHSALLVGMLADNAQAQQQLSAFLEEVAEQGCRLWRRVQDRRAEHVAAAALNDFVVVAAEAQRVAVAADVAPVGAQAGGPARDALHAIEGLRQWRSTLVTQAAAVLNERAMRLLTGLDFGKHLAGVVGSVLPARGARPSGSELEVADFAVDAVCTVAGLALAHAMKLWATLWATCSLGARLVVEAADAQFHLQVASGPLGALAVPALAGVGFAYQAYFKGHPPLPWPLWILLAPARAADIGFGCLLA